MAVVLASIAMDWTYCFALGHHIQTRGNVWTTWTL